MALRAPNHKHSSPLAILFAAALTLACPVGARGAEPVSVGPGRQPQVAVSSDDVYVAHAHEGAIVCAVSRDGGRTFDRPVEIAWPKDMPVGMRRGPRIAATGNSVVITAIERPSAGSGDVIAWRSADRGRSWSRVGKAISSVPNAAREGLHGMAAGPDGQVFCVWLDLRNTAPGRGHGGHTEIWGARSADGGATWSDDFLIYRSPQKSVCQCCHPSVVYSPDGNRLAVLFRNELSGNRDMYVMESRDGGKSFGTAQKLGDRSWELNACPMDGGMVTYPRSGQEGGDVAPAPVTAWRRAGEVFIARPGESEQKLGDGMQPWVTSSDGVPIVAWVTARPGALLVRQGDGPSKKIAEAASDPSLAAALSGRGPLLAAWESRGNVVVQVLTNEN